MLASKQRTTRWCGPWCLPFFQLLIWCHARHCLCALLTPFPLCPLRLFGFPLFLSLRTPPSSPLTPYLTPD
ncbi:hypothetical protein HDK64DRAFT_274889 [Phyllosticta capitalensis]